jgi:hypothetical protein
VFLSTGVVMAVTRVLDWVAGLCGRPAAALAAEAAAADRAAGCG